MDYISYRELEVPQTGRTRHPWVAKEIDRLREQFKTETEQDGAVLRWRSNNRPVPSCVFRDAYCEPTAEHTAVEDAENDAFIAEYRARMANHVPDAEERYEMTAAFGPGTKVVNAITGKVTQL